MKKIIALLFIIVFLTACGGPKKPDYELPTITPPDLEKLHPPFGPNDPPPAVSEPLDSEK